MKSKNLLDRLANGIVIGDGGFVFALEKRGYVKAGPWSPEATVENPEAVTQLHREFLRAGADVMQCFTFYASEDKLNNRGNEAGGKFGVKAINDAACKIARKVADEGDGVMTAAGVCQTPTYLNTRDKEQVQAEFRKQCEMYKGQVDFMIAEYFEHVEEIVWAIEVLKEMNVPVCANMCINKDGDLHGVSAGDCAIQMAKAGADVVGINCHFGPVESLETVRVMKKALDEADLHPYLMVQPLAYHTPDADKCGFISLDSFPFALEPRICTRWDIHKYAREAYNLGVRYIGGCCGFEPYHIRAISEELAPERGFLPEGSQKHIPWGGGLCMHTKPFVRARASREYWEKHVPATGRPESSSMEQPEDRGLVAGSEDLKQDY